MARHHLINNDLELFLTVNAKEFKTKISKRVYSPWYRSSNEKWLSFLHMILARAITDNIANPSIVYDWKGVITKLAESGYKFDSSDYFPEVGSRLLHVEIDNVRQHIDMTKTTHYIEMIKTLHEAGTVVIEADLHKFVKKSVGVDVAVVEFFSGLGFTLDTVLTEASINNDIKTLNYDYYDSAALNPDVDDLEHDDKLEKLNAYRKEQSLKVDRIKAYFEATAISAERANEIYKSFVISYPKMETCPEFKGRYLADICISYGLSNTLKTEYFFMDVQLDLIKQLEEKSGVKFLQAHNQTNHYNLSEMVGKKRHWEL